MTAPSETIASAGNIEVPAYLTLLDLGFTITCERQGPDAESWVAVKEGLQLVADSPLELLGLATMRRERGRSWRAKDEEIESLIRTFAKEGSRK